METTFVKSNDNNASNYAARAVHSLQICGANSPFTDISIHHDGCTCGATVKDIPRQIQCMDAFNVILKPGSTWKEISYAVAWTSFAEGKLEDMTCNGKQFHNWYWWITHWARDKMATISMTTFLNACMNFTYEFCSGVCSKGSNQQYSSNGSNNGLAPTKWLAVALNQ